MNSKKIFTEFLLSATSLLLTVSLLLQACTSRQPVGINTVPVVDSTSTTTIHADSLGDYRGTAAHDSGAKSAPAKAIASGSKKFIKNSASEEVSVTVSPPVVPNTMTERTCMVTSDSIEFRYHVISPELHGVGCSGSSMLFVCVVPLPSDTVFLYNKNVLQKLRVRYSITGGLFFSESVELLEGYLRGVRLSQTVWKAEGKFTFRMKSMPETEDEADMRIFELNEVFYISED